MKKNLRWSIPITSLILGLFFGIIWFNRYQLEYNAEGKFFDEMAMVVYEQDNSGVYGILALFFFLIGLLYWIIVMRK